MRLTRLSKDDRAFLGWILGPGGWMAVVMVILSLVALWYAAEAGVFDTINDGLGDFFSLILDGEDVGEWLAGIIIGILGALWDFGEDIGADVF